MKYLTLLSLLFAFNVKADSDFYIDDDLALADEAIQSPTMDIEGKYKIAEPTIAPAPRSLALLLTPAPSCSMRPVTSPTSS